MQSCSVKGFLDELSRVSSFTKNKELPRIYADLASSFLRAAAAPPGPVYGVFTRVKKSFYEGADEAAQFVKTNFAQTPSLSGWFEKKPVLSTFEMYSGITNDEAKVLGYYSFCYLSVVYIDSAMRSDKSLAKNWDNFVNVVTNSYSKINKYSSLRNVIEKAIASQVRQPQKLISDRIGVSSYTSQDAKAMHDVLLPKFVEFFESYPFPPFQSYIRKNSAKYVFESEKSSREFFELYQNVIKSYRELGCGTFSSTFVKRVTSQSVDQDKLKMRMPQGQQNSEQVPQDSPVEPDPVQEPSAPQEQSEEYDLTQSDCKAIKAFLTDFKQSGNIMTEILLCEGLINQAFHVARGAGQEQPSDQGQAKSDYNVAAEGICNQFLIGGGEKYGNRFTKMRLCMIMLRLLGANTGFGGY